MNRYKTRRRLVAVLKYALLGAASFLSVFPFYWMFASATNTSTDVARGRLLPGAHLLENLATMLQRYDIPRILFNSFFIALCTVVLNLLITSLAAFGFEKFGNRLTARLYSVFLLSMMIPFSALMIPLFKMMGSVGLVNSYPAVILPFASSAFLIFFFRQNFKSFPDEMLESARIDGASNLRAFATLVVPCMKATYAAAAIYAFMTAWNSYMWPLVVLQTEDKKTMTLLISALSTSSYVADYGVQMLAIVIGTLPVMLLFLFMQRSFVEGMTGSLKG